MLLTTAHLTARRLFNSHATCHPLVEATQAEPLTGVLYFHQLMWYISAGCAGLSCLIGLGLASLHIFRYRSPHIQRQLIRILWTPPIFGIFSFLAVFSYHITNYMVPIAEFYEMFALVAVYYLFLFHLSHTTNLDDQIRTITALKPNYNHAAFRKTYLSVHQVLPVRVITTIAAFIIAATSCLGDKTYKRGTTVLSIINGISAALALISLLRFLILYKCELKQADPKIFVKIISFKAIVAIQFLQKIVLNILTTANVLTPSNTMSYADLNLGLNSWLTAMEVAVICVPLMVAFWPKEFAEKRYNAANGKQGGVGGSTSEEDGAGGKFSDNNGQVVDASGHALALRKLGLVRAMIDSIDMVDIIQGIGRAVRLLRA